MSYTNDYQSDTGGDQSPATLKVRYGHDPKNWGRAVSPAIEMDKPASAVSLDHPPAQALPRLAAPENDVTGGRYRLDELLQGTAGVGAGAVLTAELPTWHDVADGIDAVTTAQLSATEADAIHDLDVEQNASMLIGIDALMEAAAKPEIPLWGDISRGLVTLLLGAPGVGKSLYGLQMLVAIATGRAFAGVHPTGAHKVVLLSPEDNAGVIGRRIAAMAQTMGVDWELLRQNLRIVNCDGPSVLFEKDGDGIRQTPAGRRFFHETKAFGAAVVGLDPMMEIHLLAESDNNSMHLLMGALRDFARTGNCAVVMFHHITKPDSDKRPTANSSRGASAITAAVRHIEIFSELEKKEREDLSLTEEQAVDIFRRDKVKSSYRRRSGRPAYFKRVSVSVNGITAPALEMIAPPKKKPV